MIKILHWYQPGKLYHLFAPDPDQFRKKVGEEKNDILFRKSKEDFPKYDLRNIHFFFF